MKLNILLPWICVLGLGAGLASVFVSSKAKDTELSRLRGEATQTQQQQTELEEAQAQAKKQAEQIAELRKDNQELLRLRSEVGQLRNEKQELSKQVQAVQTQVQQAQTQAEQAIKQSNTKAMQLAALQADEALRQKIDICISNLRQMDAAKQQWALENSKTPESAPTAQEIAPYLKGRVLPVCPAGGAYTLNPMNKFPACSIPAHAIQ